MQIVFDAKPTDAKPLRTVTSDRLRFALRRMEQQVSSARQFQRCERPSWRARQACADSIEPRVLWHRDRGGDSKQLALGFRGCAAPHCCQGDENL